MSDILIFLGSKSDLSITESGLAALKELGVSFDLKICSAHRTPKELEKYIFEFEEKNGKAYICVAGKSAHLAGVVAAQTLKPVIAVPVYGDATAGLDALLSMGQMPGGIPVATMTLGNSGFLNGCLFAAQVLSLQNSKLAVALKNHRLAQANQVIEDNKKHGISYAP